MTRAAKTYTYDREELIKKLQENPSLKINSGQLIVLFPHLTLNYIKHRVSVRCKFPMPHTREGGKPFFIFNQVDAYLSNPHEYKSDENAEVKKVKKLKEVK